MGLFANILNWLRGRVNPQGYSPPYIEAENPENWEPFSEDSSSEVMMAEYYDKHLFERARTQWQFGDWESLARIERESLNHHPQRASLALLAAAGHQQLGNMEDTREFTHLAKEWGASRKMISQVLIAGVYNTLGKASALCGQQQRAIGHFQESLRTTEDGGDIRLLTQARTQRQIGGSEFSKYDCNRSLLITSPYEQDHLDPKCSKLCNLALELQNQDCFSEADTLLIKASQRQPDNVNIREALAENAMQMHEYTTAANRWQDAVALLGAETPQRFYEKMSAAHAMVESWGGTEEENYCYGDRHKHDILQELHQKLSPQMYLEIGVDAGLGLALAECKAIGIDPRPNLELHQPLKPNAQIITASSDIFFRDYAAHHLQPRPDLVFIDGMHLFEFALRDFINVERYSKTSTLVVIDDIHPCHPSQALRWRKSDAWTGDVWKLYAILKEWRPDLHIIDVDANTTGLLFIVGLDSNNHSLAQCYDNILNKYKSVDRVPDAILNRNHAISSDDGIMKVLRWFERK